MTSFPSSSNLKKTRSYPWFSSHIPSVNPVSSPSKISPIWPFRPPKTTAHTMATAPRLGCCSHHLPGLQAFPLASQQSIPKFSSQADTVLFFLSFETKKLQSSTVQYSTKNFSSKPPELVANLLQHYPQMLNTRTVQITTRKSSRWEDSDQYATVTKSSHPTPGHPFHMVGTAWALTPHIACSPLWTLPSPWWSCHIPHRATCSETSCLHRAWALTPGTAAVPSRYGHSVPGHPSPPPWAHTGCSGPWQLPHRLLTLWVSHLMKAAQNCLGKGKREWLLLNEHKLLHSPLFKILQQLFKFSHNKIQTLFHSPLDPKNWSHTSLQHLMESMLAGLHSGFQTYWTLLSHLTVFPLCVPPLWKPSHLPKSTRSLF